MNGTCYTGCVNASSVIISKNKVDKLHIEKNGWTLDKPLASLPFVLVDLDGALVKSF